MYTKDKLITVFKIKNILFYTIAVLEGIFSIWDILSLYSTYHDDLETFWSARSMPTSIMFLIISFVLICVAHTSNKMIEDVRFISNYFELNLNGIISINELSNLYGKNEKILNVKISIYKFLYMKGFTIENNNLVLESKTCQCECRNCGGIFDKKIFFEGKCPYCGNNDVFAKVISANHICSIETNPTPKKKTLDFYLKKNMNIFYIKTVIEICVVCSVMLISFCGVCSITSEMNDKEYLREQLLSGKAYSYDLIRHDMFDTVMLFAVIGIAMIPLFIFCIKRIIRINYAKKCAHKFSIADKHYVNMTDVPISGKKAKEKVRPITKLIRAGYLKNCSIECISGRIRVALARRIIKDKCPYCSAPMLGIKNENYTCTYCGRKIFSTVTKA